MPTPTTLLPFQPAAMSTSQLAAVSYLARYSGRTHALYSFQLREWFAWCEANGLDALAGVQRAHVELYIRHLGDRGLMDSSVVTMMHAVRGYFRFAHIDGLIAAGLPECTQEPQLQDRGGPIWTCSPVEARYWSSLTTAIRASSRPPSELLGPLGGPPARRGTTDRRQTRTSPKRGAPTGSQG